jgi:chemotaxis protein methyltransferase CheR
MSLTGQRCGVINCLNTPRLSDSDFNKLKQFIEKEVGIKISDAKRILLETRLYKRLKALNLNSFREYCDYVFGGNDLEEIINLIDHVTTNKTEFFRENNHFEILKKNILPELFEIKNHINIWSSACSTGEEPYTISMVIKDFIDKKKTNLTFSVLASDISTRVLQTALKAIYPIDKINEIPKDYYKYLLKSKDPTKRLIRISPEIRKFVSFKRINLLEDFPFKQRFDIIFCRNVLIYFDKETQEHIIRKFYDVLELGGLLFLGHSETFHGIKAKFKKVAPSVYLKEAL